MNFHDFQTVIVDFDSTLIQVESLDVLAELTLEGRANKAERCAEITRCTDAAMNGQMTFTESLRLRLTLLDAHKQDIERLVDILHGKITPSVARHTSWFAANSDRVLVMSGGFAEFITPVVERLGIAPERVYANTFTFDADGKITGADQNNPLAYENGKPTLARKLSAQGIIKHPACIIGDGYSDYQLRGDGAVEYFYAHVENVRREKPSQLADAVITSFDALLMLDGGRENS
jgi:D-3-phosphoglycerate dehydrogenase / 2-oxoglutarate reductase